MPQIHYIPRDKGSFVIEENSKRIAEMVVDISAGLISVYHTGVVPEKQGQGIGSRLIEGMAHYAQQNKLKVVPYCPYVKAEFKKHPERYAAIWQK